MFTLKQLNRFSKKGFVKKLRKYSKLSYVHKVGKEPLRPLTVGKLLEIKGKQEGDKPMIVSKHQNKTLSYIEVLNQADKLAAGLRRVGLQRGDRVAIWAPNLIEWHVTNMACARAGFILVCCNPALQAKEIQYSITKVSVKAMICSHKFKTQNYYEILNQVAPEISQCDPGKIRSKSLPSLESVVILEGEEDLRGAFSYQEIMNSATDAGIRNIQQNQNDVQPDDPFHIQFTSIGSRVELHNKHHIICAPTPLFHALATDAIIMAALNHGSTLVLPGASFDADKSLDTLRDDKCTVIYGTPTMYVDIVERQKVRKEKIEPDYAIWGGASASPHLLKEIKEHLNLKKIKAVYGMTECTSVTFQTLPEDDDLKSFTTVGYLSDHLEAKVVDSSGKIVPRGIPGELYVRGFNCTIEYWKDDQKTRELIGKDRWLRTGDQFVIDEDGYGHVVGRLKELIIRGGENIFPREVEDFLNTHPDIVENHVIGLLHERLGEEVCACVRLREGVTELSLKDLKLFCKGKIAYYKIPSVLKIVENFPKTQSGKIQKFKLVEIYSK